MAKILLVFCLENFDFNAQSKWTRSLTYIWQPEYPILLNDPHKRSSSVDKKTFCIRIVDIICLILFI